MLLGLILGTLSFLGISLCLIRLYVASRINRRHRFCEELITGDYVWLPLEAKQAAHAVSQAGGLPSGRTGSLTHKGQDRTSSEERF